METWQETQFLSTSACPRLGSGSPAAQASALTVLSANTIIHFPFMVFLLGTIIDSIMEGSKSLCYRHVRKFFFLAEKACYAAKHLQPDLDRHGNDRAVAGQRSHYRSCAGGD